MTNYGINVLSLVFGRSSSESFRCNSFLLGLFSPVLRPMLCRGFKESSGKSLELKEVDAGAFSKVLDLWCGGNGYQEIELSEMQQLAVVADQFQITEVLAALEDAMMTVLSVDVCVEMLTLSSSIGTMQRLKAVARKMTMERFGDVMATAGFMRIEEESLRSILEEWKFGKVCAMLRTDGLKNSKYRSRLGYRVI
jgi:hypothetical protein